MKTKTQIVFVVSVLAILTGVLLAVVRLPQKGKGQEVWLNQWDIALWAVAGIVILVLIVFGLRKFGTAPNSWFPPWLKGLVAIAVIVGASLWIYREWDLVEKGFQKGLDYANKAMVYTIPFENLGDITIPLDKNLEGKFLIRIPDQEYSFSCMNGAYGNGHTTETACKDCRPPSKHGNIVFRVKKGGQEARSGQPIVIYKGEPVIAAFSFDNRWENEILPKDKSSCNITAGKQRGTIEVSLTLTQ